MKQKEIIKNPKFQYGGAVLLEKHGREYFVKLAKKGAKKRRMAAKLWEKQEALKNNVKPVKARAK